MQRTCTRNIHAATAALTTLLLTAFVVTGCGGGPPQKNQAQILADEAWTRLSQNEGGELVLRAITAHGGLEAWYAKKTAAWQWEYYNFGANLRFTSHQVIDLSSRRIYHDLSSLGTADEALPVRGRFAWNGADAWIAPADIQRINPRFWALTPFYFQFIPFVLADPGATYEMLPEAELDGAMYDMVKVGFQEDIGDAPGDTYTLYVDRTTSRVEAIRYTVTFGGRAARRETLFDYEEFATVDGLTLATRFYGYRFQDGEKGSESNGGIAEGIAYDVPFDETRLVMPLDGRVQPLPGE